MLLGGIALARSNVSLCFHSVALCEGHVALQGIAFGDVDGDITLNGGAFCSV